MPISSFIATRLNLLCNSVLFFFKIIAGLHFGSLSLISDAINSFSDILSAVLIMVSVKINNKPPDENHPFGHTRAESIAGYTIGVIMLFLALKICEQTWLKFINQSFSEYNILLFVIVGITFVVKLFLYLYTKEVLKKENSPALKANLQDHLNDILISLSVAISVAGSRFGLHWFDIVISLFICGIITKSAVEICRENVAELMGEQAEKNHITEIENLIESITEVKKIKFIRTQKLGNKIQVELDLMINNNLSFMQSYELHQKIKSKIKNLDTVISCAVHLYPVF